MLSVRSWWKQCGQSMLSRSLVPGPLSLRSMKVKGRPHALQCSMFMREFLRVLGGGPVFSMNGPPTTPVTRKTGPPGAGSSDTDGRTTTHAQSHHPRPRTDFVAPPAGVSATINARAPHLRISVDAETTHGCMTNNTELRPLPASVLAARAAARTRAGLQGTHLTDRAVEQAGRSTRPRRRCSRFFEPPPFRFRSSEAACSDSRRQAAAC